MLQMSNGPPSHGQNPVVDELGKCVRTLYELQLKQLNALGQAASIKAQIERAADPRHNQQLADMYLQSLVFSSQTLSISSGMSEKLIGLVTSPDRSPRKRSSRNSAASVQHGGPVAAATPSKHHPGAHIASPPGPVPTSSR